MTIFGDVRIIERLYKGYALTMFDSMDSKLNVIIKWAGVLLSEMLG